MNRTTLRVLFAAAAVVPLAAQSNAAQVLWTVDQALSSFALSIPQQIVNISGSNYTMRLVNQNASGDATGTSWTVGNSAQLSGTLASDYIDGLSLQLLAGQQNISAVAGANRFPNPANFVQGATLDPGQGSFTGTNGGSALAAYGAFAQVQFLGFQSVGPVSLPSLDLDLASAVINTSGGTFPASQTSVGVEQAGIAVDITGGLVSAVLGYSGILSSFSAAPLANTNAAMASIINTGPLTRRLTLPITVPISVSSGTFALVGTATGTIVANATIPVPEPGGLLLAASGLTLFCLTGLRRWRRPKRST